MFCETHQCERKPTQRKRGNKYETNYICEKCVYEKRHQWYIDNIEAVKERDKLYHAENREKRNAQSKQYQQEHKEEISKQRKEYYSENKDKLNAQSRQYHYDNKNECNARSKDYYDSHKEEAAAKKKIYYSINKDAIIEKNNINEKKRRKQDPAFRLRKDVSRVVSAQLKKTGGTKRGGSITDVLNSAYFDRLSSHIESLFSHPDNLTRDGKVWMTMDNQGTYKISEWDDNDPSTWRWQKDHIIPHKRFKYTLITDPEFMECWDIHNLRPLSAKRNIKDNDNRTDEQIVTIKKSIADFLESKKNGKE